MICIPSLSGTMHGQILANTDRHIHTHTHTHTHTLSFINIDNGIFSFKILFGTDQINKAFGRLGSCNNVPAERSFFENKELVCQAGPSSWSVQLIGKAGLLLLQRLLLVQSAPLEHS